MPCIVVSTGGHGKSAPRTDQGKDDTVFGAHHLGADKASEDALQQAPEAWVFGREGWLDDEIQSFIGASAPRDWARDMALRQLPGVAPREIWVLPGAVNGTWFSVLRVMGQSGRRGVSSHHGRTT